MIPQILSKILPWRLVICLGGEMLETCLLLSVSYGERKNHQVSEQVM